LLDWIWPPCSQHNCQRRLGGGCRALISVGILLRKPAKPTDDWLRDDVHPDCESRAAISAPIGVDECRNYRYRCNRDARDPGNCQDGEGAKHAPGCRRSIPQGHSIAAARFQILFEFQRCSTWSV